MTVLITASNNGTPLGTCNKTCYDAKADRCQCICYGLNHGVGLETALVFTQQLQRLMAKQIKIRFPQVTLVTFYQPYVQMRFHAPQPNPHTLPFQRTSIMELTEQDKADLRHFAEAHGEHWKANLAQLWRNQADIDRATVLRLRENIGLAKLMHLTLPDLQPTAPNPA